MGRTRLILLNYLIQFSLWEMHGVRSHNAQTLQCGYCGRTFMCALCDLTPYALGLWLLPIGQGITLWLKWRSISESAELQWAKR